METPQNQASDTVAGAPKRSGTRKMMLLVFLAACLCWLIVPVFQARSRAFEHAICVNNMKVIALALHNYHSAYGCFPPAVVTDPQGKPMHSWRVLLLPFMELGGLYNRYNFNEPWDGPSNIKLLDQMPLNYACPSIHNRTRTSLTNYVMIAEKGRMIGTMSSTPDEQEQNLSSKTLMAVEVSNLDIPWTKPIDLDIATMSFQVNDPDEPSLSSKHPAAPTVVFTMDTSDFSNDSLERIFGDREF